MSGEILTQGTEIWVLDTTSSPTALLKLTNATGLGEYGPQSGDIDITNLDSTAMEYLTGIPDNGEVTFNANLADSAAHRWLTTNVGSGDLYYFCIGFSDGTNDPTIGVGTITAPTGRTADVFQATVKAFRSSIGTNDVIKANGALRVSGAITRTWKSENP